MTIKSNWVDVNPLSLQALDKLRECGFDKAIKGFLKLTDVVATLGWQSDSRRHQTAVAKGLKAIGWRKVRVKREEGSSKYEYLYLHKNRVDEAKTLAQSMELENPIY
jgi:hypothetical protein